MRSRTNCWRRRARRLSEVKVGDPSHLLQALPAGAWCGLQGDHGVATIGDADSLGRDLGFLRGVGHGVRAGAHADRAVQPGVGHRRRERPHRLRSAERPACGLRREQSGDQPGPGEGHDRARQLGRDPFEAGTAGGRGGGVRDGRLHRGRRRPHRAGPGGACPRSWTVRTRPDFEPSSAAALRKRRARCRIGRNR